MANKQTEICFICGKKKSEVDRLLKGQFGGCICNECVKEAYKVLDEDEEDEITEEAGDTTEEEMAYEEEEELEEESEEDEEHEEN